MRGRDLIGEEKKIGQKYARELRNHFKKQISVLDKKTGMLSKPGYNVKLRDFYLQSISVKTLKYAFVLHHGVDKKRIEHSFQSKSGKTFTRTTHSFKLQSKFNIEIVESLILEFAREISELRGDRVLAEMSKQWQAKA